MKSGKCLICLENDFRLARVMEEILQGELRGEKLYIEQVIRNHLGIDFHHYQIHLFTHSSIMEKLISACF